MVLLPSGGVIYDENRRKIVGMGAGMKRTGLALLFFVLIVVLVVSPVRADWLNVTPYAVGSPFRNSAESTYSDLRNGAGTSTNGPPYMYLWLAAGTDVPNRFDELDRIIVVFDASDLPEDAVIDSASMTLLFTVVDYVGLYGYVNIGLTNGTVGNVDGIDASDYERAGNLTISDYFNFTSETPTTAVFNFNTDGKDYINRTAKTIVFIRMSDDIGGAFTGSWYSGFTTDIDTSETPYLNISYTTETTPTPTTPTPTTTIPTTTPTTVAPTANATEAPRGLGIRYPSHNVKFFVRNGLGVPLANVTVTATYMEASGPLDWLYSWLGMSATVTPQNTSLTGHTGTDGALNFMMIEMMKYHVIAVGDEINVSMDVYPKDDTYTIWSSDFGSSQWFEHHYNELEVIDFSASSAEVNSSYGVANVTYIDALHETSSAYVWVNRTEAGSPIEYEITNYTDTSGGNFTHSLWIPDPRGHSYIVRLNATHTEFGNVYRVGSFSFDSGPLQVGPIPESWHLPIALSLLLFIGMLIPISGTGPGLLFFCFAAWAFFGIRWLDDLAPRNTTMAAITLATVVTLAYIFKDKLREG